MHPVHERLEAIRGSLNGTTASLSEVAELEAALPFALPAWFREMLVRFPIAGVQFSLGENVDESGLGVELQWLTTPEMLAEAREFYPGIAALPSGYLPVGTCLLGTGDPYFVRILDSTDCPLVRIPHDAKPVIDIAHGKTVADDALADDAEQVSDTLAAFLRDASVA